MCPLSFTSFHFVQFLQIQIGNISITHGSCFMQKIIEILNVDYIINTKMISHI